MTDAPADLLTVRQHVMALTGLRDPADVGIVGDATHQRSGGYHLGRDGLVTLGALHSDYSVAEYDRDRRGLTNSASALDIGLAWPNGGRAAAIRFTMLMVGDLLTGAPGTDVLRGMNYTDGTAKRRRDKRNGLIATSSTDSVDIHTHFEFWRDTEGRRGGAFLDLVLRRIRHAITGITESTTTARGKQMLIAHEKGSNVDWVGDGVTRRRIADANDRVNTMNVLRAQGYPETQVQSAEFNPGTMPALGVDVATLTAVPGGVDVDVLAAKVVAGVVAAHGALTVADEPIIAAAVKDALRAGTG